MPLPHVTSLPRRRRGICVWRSQHTPLSVGITTTTTTTTIIIIIIIAAAMLADFY